MRVSELLHHSCEDGFDVNIFTAEKNLFEGNIIDVDKDLLRCLVGAFTIRNNVLYVCLKS